MKLISTVTLVLLSFLTQAQDTARSEAGLKSATVYFGNGAELTHEGKVTITPNTRQIVINKLSNHLDLNSLQINLPEQVSLLAQQFNIFTPPVPKVEKNPLEAKMYDSIKAFNKVIKRLQYQVETENLTMDKTTRLIESTLLTAGNKTVVSDEALKLINALTAKVEKSRALLYKLTQERDSIQNINSEIQIRIDNLPEPIVKTEKSYGQLVLQVICRESATIPVSFSYYTQKAGWIPLYDLRVNSKTNEVKLVYKASLNQTTGLDWKQIKLTLSTGNPNWSGAAPLLQAWYLQIYTPVLYQTIQTQALTTTVTNSYNYYQNKDLEEVVVTDNGYAKKSRNLAAATQNIDPSTLQAYTTLNQSQLNTNFEIDLPYDINSDGTAHSVAIRDQKVNASLKNYAVPKMDKDAYLLAGLTDWQELELLPGTANIILDNTYLGKSYIDPNSTADTLNISMGKDKRIALKRELMKNFTSSKNNGSNTIQTFTYEITVKNNKSTEVDITLKDQYPLSNIKEVEIKLITSEEASVNEELGILNWQIKLKPGESKKVRFSYSVKYPKDKKINNL